MRTSKFDLLLLIIGTVILGWSAYHAVSVCPVDSGHFSKCTTDQVNAVTP